MNRAELWVLYISPCSFVLSPSAWLHHDTDTGYKIIRLAVRAIVSTKRECSACIKECKHIRTFDLPIMRPG